jgi:hypothetical protein
MLVAIKDIHIQKEKLLHIHQRNPNTETLPRHSSRVFNTEKDSVGTPNIRLKTLNSKSTTQVNARHKNLHRKLITQKMLHIHK